MPREHIPSLEARVAELAAKIASLDAAAGDKTMTAEQLAEFNAAVADHESTTKRLEDARKAERIAAAIAKPVEPVLGGAKPNAPAGGTITGHDNAEDAPWDKENNFGRAFAAFFQAVHKAEPRVSGEVDPRLRRTAASSNEGIGSEDGFGLDPSIAVNIDKLMFDSALLAQRCMQVEVGPGRNSASVRVIDETSRVSGSRFGGITVYHAAEGATVTASRPKVRLVDVKLEKIMGLWNLSDEEIEDGSYLASVGPQAFAEEIGFVVDNDIFRGSGAGMALGIINAPCLVSVAKETGQAAKTIMFENVLNMWARLPARSRLRAGWFINVDCEPQLNAMTLGIGTSGQPVYLPPGGASAAQYGSLFGRPVVPIEQASTCGTKGDIVLADFGWYAHVRKAGVKAAQSIHVRFVYDEMSFRFTYRSNGLPVLGSAVTPAQGSNTVSPFVAPDARA